MIEVEGPNGIVVEFPDNTSKEVMTAAMRQKFGEPQPDIGNYGVNLMRQAVSGIPIVGALPNKLNAATDALLQPLAGTGAEATSFGERYAKNLAEQNSRDDAFAKRNPIAATAAGIAGGVAATLPVAGTATGARMLGLTGSTLPRQVAAGATSGAAIGGADAALRGQDVESGAVTGGVLGAAGPVVGRVVGGLADDVSRSATPTQKALFKSGDSLYNEARALGVEFKPSSISALADRIENDLVHQHGFRPLGQKQTFALLNEMRPGQGVNSVLMDDLDAVRRALSKAAASPEEKSAATKAISAIDSYVANVAKVSPQDVVRGDAQELSRIISQARADWGAAKRSQLVEKSGTKADRQAASAGAGGNIDNATRQQIKGILNSEKKLRGFSAQEIDAMETLVRGTKPGNLARLVGKLSPTGIVSGSLSGGTGYALGGPFGAIAIPVLGLIAKKIGDASTARQLAKLDNLIRQRSHQWQSNPMRQALEDQRRALIGAAGSGVFGAIPSVSSLSSR